MSFMQAFFNLYGVSEDNTAVCCPFEHTTSTGIHYMEHHPSAHVKLSEGLFHCKVCERGYNELTFIKALYNCSMKTALRLEQLFKTPETIEDWRAVKQPEIVYPLATSLGISQDTITQLDLAADDTESILFPVFMYGHIVDIRCYRPGKTPKMIAKSGTVSGLIYPFDLWRTEQNRITLLCAGEKDMAIARSHGFSAITLTGGEQALPFSTGVFKDRRVVIVYDNDESGKQGALKIANALQDTATWIKVCTSFHEICKEPKEDITDFFTKYHKTRDDLIECIENTPYYTPELYATIHAAQYPIVNLHAATEPQNIGKLLRSNVQVVSMSEASYVVPDTLVGRKLNSGLAENATTDAMAPGDLRTWELCENTLQDILHLMDNNFTEDAIKKHWRELLRIKHKEPGIKLQSFNKVPVFKCCVTDLYETIDSEIIPMEYVAYSINMKLESGKKYLLTYKLVPHPYKGQQLTMIVSSATNANDTVTNFTVTDTVKEQLQIFQNIPGTVEERVEHLTERVKGLLGYDGCNTLIQTIDFAYHTVLQFNFGRFKNERGYLDTFIVGESRTGKSSTANVLRKTYKLGAFTSLAGSSATIPGLVGGSSKQQSGAFQTRAGLIPQNHKGLLIMEEFAKSATNIIAELTDIRSSNEVRITRVSGVLNLPAAVRMITLTNVKPSEGIIKPIAAYPNGIAIITELIGTAEDIARYDLLVVLGTRGTQQIDPLWEPLEPLPEEAYETRVRWVWSRTAEQVTLSNEVCRYIMAKANELNAQYDCHIKIFGTEAWKKITRLAISVAGYTVSTDETYEQIVVLPEHVDYAVNFFIRLYDNSVFKLKEYTEYERKFSQIDADGVAALQDLYIRYTSLILHLEQAATTSKNAVQAATGLTNDDYNRVMNRLIAGSFVQLSKQNIIPTERFRKGVAQVNRNVHAERVGENRA